MVAVTDFPKVMPRFRSATVFPVLLTVPVPTATLVIANGTVRLAEPSVWLRVWFVIFAWKAIDAPAGTVLGETTTENGLVAAPAGAAGRQAAMMAVSSAAPYVRGRREGTVVPSASR